MNFQAILYLMIIQVPAFFRQDPVRIIRRRIIRRIACMIKSRGLSFAVLGSLVWAPACIFQDRNDLINQNQEGQVVSIKELTDLRCRLHTGPRKEKKIPSSKARTFLLERKDTNDDSYADAKEEPIWYDYEDDDEEENSKKKRGLLNNFSYVPVTSVKPQESSGGEIKCRNLLSRNIHPLLKARSGHAYEVRFQVRAGLVRALAVDRPENLPFSAHSYSLALEDGRLAMPIGGWKAPAVYPENQRNPDQEDTNILAFRPRDITAHKGFEDLKIDGIPHRYPSGAKYVQFTDGLFKPYQTLEENSLKEDVYPKSFFQGEWFYSVTPVTASSKSGFGGGAMQHFMSLDQDGRRAPVIRFVFEENFMKAQNIDRETEEDPETTPSVNPDRWVISIPLKNKDYSSRQIGKDLNAGLREAEDPRASFRDRPLAQFHFHSVKSVVDRWIHQVHQKGGVSKSSYSLEELTFSEDYFSFLLKEQSLNFTIRYSFLRRKKPEESSYSPLFLTEKMMQLFPVFTFQKRVSFEDEMTLNRNYQKRAAVVRFNLQQKPVKYYFSEMTPEDESVRALGRESVNIWNQIFKKAGVPCPGGLCFELDESKTVPLGDLRYNVFNLINPKEGGNQLSHYGIGPTLADYETGEVVSATANFNLLLARRGLVFDIERYIQRETGMAGLFFERTALAGSSRAGSSRAGSGGGSGRLSSGGLPSFMIKKSLLKVPLSFLASFAQTAFLNKMTGPSRDIINNAASLAKEGDKPASFQALSRLQDIYGFRETEDGLPLPILSLEEALTEEEKSEMRFNYEMLTGETPPKDLKELIAKHEEGLASSGHCNLQHQKAEAGGLAGDRIFSLIDRLCRQDLSFIPSLKSKTAGLSPHLQRKELYLAKGREDVEKEIHDCADKILPLTAFEVVLHEQGHNIGMPHNFAGSADTANFLKNEDFSHLHIAAHLEDEEKAAAFDLLQTNSSSIMDYNIDTHISPGAYDTAFARFYYAGQIEGADGEIHEALLEQEDPTGGKPLKTYRVCNDEHSWGLRLGNDIFCDMFDLGGTAYEIVKNHYNRFINLPSQFLNQAFPLGRQKPELFAYKTWRIYNQWRVKISEHLNTDDSKNLSDISSEEWNDQTLALIGAGRCGAPPAAEKDFRETTDCVCAGEDTEEWREQAKNCLGEETETCKKAILRDLYCARGKIARTFYDLLFEAHDHYCHAENLLTGRREIIPFSRLHRTLRAEAGETLKEVSSCYDIEDELKASGWKLEKETGYPLFPGVFSTNINRLSRDWPTKDYRGSFSSRLKSGALFLIATPLVKAGELISYSPIRLLDEPDIRRSVRKRVTDRITKGIKMPETQAIEQSDAEEALQQAPAAPALQGPLSRKESHYYNFDNENLLWSVLSFPLLNVHPFTHFSGYFGNILLPYYVRINHPGAIDGWTGGRDPGADFYAYLKARSSTPHLYIYRGFPEPGEEAEDKSPVMLFPIDPARHVKRLIRSLRERDVAESFKIFGENLLEWNEKTHQNQEEGPADKTIYEPCGLRTASPLPSFAPAADSRAADAGAAVTEFIKKNIRDPVDCLIFQSNTDEVSTGRTFALTYALLYDYLADGLKFFSHEGGLASAPIVRRPRFITNSLVEIQQAGLIMEYSAGKPEFDACETESGERASAEIPTCFQGFRLNDFWTKRVDHERHPDERVSWLKPYLKVLREREPQACGNPELQKTALALYHLEAFKPDSGPPGNETGAELQALLQTAFGSQKPNGVHPPSCNLADSSHPSMLAAKIEADYVKNHIEKLKILIHFPQSLFLREIFFLSLFEKEETQNLIINLLDLLVKLQEDAGYVSSLQKNSIRKHYASDDGFFDQIHTAGENLPAVVNRHSQAFNRFFFHSIDRNVGETEDTSDSMLAKEFRIHFKNTVHFSLDNMENDMLRHVLSKLSEDYISESQALNLSEGGVFSDILKNRLNEESRAQEILLIRALNPFLSIDFIR